MRLSTFFAGAKRAASQICPSCNSPSPCKEKTKLFSPFLFLVHAAPMATDMPCPKEPEDMRTPGKPSCVVGCPCKRELSLRKVFNSSTGKYPLLAKTE